MDKGTKKSKNQNMAHHFQYKLLARKAVKSVSEIAIIENQNSA